MSAKNSPAKVAGKAIASPTTTQSLGSLLKSARDTLLRQGYAGQVMRLRNLAL